MAARISRPERRAAPRVQESLPLALTDAGTELSTTMLNISAGGVSCVLDRFLTPMSKLQIRFELPQGKHPIRIQCTGVVVRVDPAVGEGQRPRYQTAIFFTELSERDRRRMARFVTQRLASATTQR
jgi:c-di-GMP-binding flagellar brake protein YcgR